MESIKWTSSERRIYERRLERRTGASKVGRKGISYGDRLDPRPVNLLLNRPFDLDAPR